MRTRTRTTAKILTTNLTKPQMIANKKVAVVMIVKNEESVIARAIESVKPIADLFIISDTGSTDNTSLVLMDLFNSYEFRGTMRRFYSDNWVNFAHNRNKALDHFHEYAFYLNLDLSEWLVLSMDADDQLVFIAEDDSDATTEEPTIGISPANANVVSIDYKLKNLVYSRPSMVGDTNNWRWEGPVHEYLAYTANKDRLVHGSLTGAFMLASSSEGARSIDPDKYLKDALLLEAALADDPGNKRNQFYLARSYHDHYRMLCAAGTEGRLPILVKATNAYALRAKKSDAPDTFEEERWYAQYMAAVLSRNLTEMLDVVSQRPHRAEAALDGSVMAEEQGKQGLALMLAILAVEASSLTHRDILFVDSSAYGLRSFDRLGTVAYYSGFYELGMSAVKWCIDYAKNCVSVPEADSARFLVNLEFYNKKIQETFPTK